MQAKWSGHLTEVNRQVCLITNHQMRSEGGEGQRWGQQDLQQQQRGDREEA